MRLSLQSRQNTNAPITLFFVLALSVLSLALIILYIKGVDLFNNTQLHGFWLNVFMVNVTFMGDAWFAIGLLVWLTYKKHPARQHTMVSCLLAMGFIQWLNNWFAGWPFDWFVEQGQYLFFTSREEQLLMPGFLSGHTVLAFTMAGGLARYARFRWMVVLLALAAVMVAMSRLYLSGQGLIAVLMGSLIGILTNLLAVWMLEGMTGRKGFSNWKWRMSGLHHGPANKASWGA